MAPKRAGGGGGGGTTSSCPGAFDTFGTPLSRVPYFVADCLFFLITLCILVATWRVKRRHANAKKLLGPIFLISLCFTLIGYACRIIAAMLQECHTTPYWSFYQWAIAFVIFLRLGQYLLLVIVVYSVNSLLRNHHGHNPTYLKFIYGAILAILGLLTCGYIGLQSYNYWLYSGDTHYIDVLMYEQLRLSMVYWVMYLLSVVAAGALATITIVSMRSRRIPTSDLTGRVIALIFLMFIWVVFYIVEGAYSLQNNDDISYKVWQAFYFVEAFFQSFSWICLILVAKSRVFAGMPANLSDLPIYNNTTYPQPQQPAYLPVLIPPQQQYAYNNGHVSQQYYYQQQPVYNGSPSPVNGNRQVVEVK